MKAPPLSRYRQCDGLIKQKKGSATQQPKTQRATLKRRTKKIPIWGISHTLQTGARLHLKDRNFFTAPRGVGSGRGAASEREEQANDRRSTAGRKRSQSEAREAAAHDRRGISRQAEGKQNEPATCEAVKAQTAESGQGGN